MRNQGTAREGVDEGPEIERERQDPKQRYRRDVGGEVAGDAKQERARERRQREDATHRQRGGSGARRHDGVQSPGFPLRRRTGAGVSRCGSPPKDEEEGREREGRGAPQPRLSVQPEERLEEEGKRDERTGRTRVGGRIEEVGIGGRGACPGPRQPALDERCQGRCGDEGEPERARKRAEQPQSGWQSARGCLAEEPELADWRGEGDSGPQPPEHDELSGGRCAAREEMRQSVAAEQRRLEEHHGGVPHRGRAAEHGKDAAHRERLDPEHEPRGGEHDGAVEPRRGGRACHGRCPHGSGGGRPLARGGRDGVRTDADGPVVRPSRVVRQRRDGHGLRLVHCVICAFPSNFALMCRRPRFLPSDDTSMSN